MGKKNADDDYDEVDLSEIGATDEQVKQVKEIVAKRRREREAKEREAKEKPKTKKNGKKK
jgi:hypothetical protein